MCVRGLCWGLCSLFLPSHWQAATKLLQMLEMNASDDGLEPGMVIQAYNPTQEVEMGRSQVQDPPGLQIKFNLRKLVSYLK